MTGVVSRLGPEYIAIGREREVEALRDLITLLSEWARFAIYVSENTKR